MAIRQFEEIRICHTCDGTGISTRATGGVGEKPQFIDESCLVCGGLGEINDARIELSQNLFPTYKILEATNPAEYVALSPGQATIYGLIISAGIVDLSETTSALTILRGMFGEGSTTRTNLEELIG
jgi:hypothetical protein